MKRILLPTIFCFVLTVSSYAALNPFAYGLSSTLSTDEATLTINYSLNAPATSVSVVILDGETVVKTVDCAGIAKGSYNVDVPTTDFPKGKTLKWKVEVTGTSVESPELQSETFSFYLPYSMDVDTDTESDKFGRWYVIEGARKSTNQTHTGYHSYDPNNNVRGLCAFDAALNPIPNSSGNYVFTGGMTVGATETNVTNDYVNLYSVTTSGGRVFVGRFRNGYAPILEATDLHSEDYPIVLSSAGGRAVSIDAIGRGENLKLVMLDTEFNIKEYDLGTATSWATPATPSRTYDKGSLTIDRNDAAITYDNDGGIWINQNSASNPTIAHLTTSGLDYDNITAGLAHILGEEKYNIRGAAVNFEGTELAVPGAGRKNVAIFNISKDSEGKISLTQKYTVTTGNNNTALSYDYAGNLYVANRSAETITFYAMPYSGTVSTPCPSTQTFSLTADPQLNPFAYNLTSELSADEKNLTINYSLNAKATSVNWVLMDGNNVVKTIDLASLGLEKGNYTTTISTTDFPTYKQLTWKIEVKGVAVNEPTEYSINHSFYHPSSVDIDNNPENETFGLLLVNDAMQAVKNQTTHADGSTYVGSGFGAGIFAFNPAFENTGKYNGGIEFKTTRADGLGNAYAPRRIRISDDGRIFVTSLNTDGNYLWEVNPEDMDEWTPIFKGTLNSEKELTDANGNFMVGPNNGFDVKGAGENLQLLMYSVNLSGIKSATMDGFKCAEYNLGTATSWTTAPSKMWIEGKYAINYVGTQVVYDNEGGIWIASHRGSASDANPGLVHLNKDGIEDLKLVWSNVQQAGIRFNNDFTKLVVAGISEETSNSKKATIYTVSKDANGAPVLTEETVIDMATVGNSLNDFAWDYANNLYACGNSNEKLAVWAMPHSSDDVVATPAASGYAFSIGKYTMTLNTNDEDKGTVTGAGEYTVGTTATITATPKEGYKLLYWSDRSTENPRTITMNKNEALSAYFVKEYDVEPTFSITKVWENTNVPSVNTNGYQAVGWDGNVYLQASADNKIMVYNGTDAATEYASSGAGYQIAVDEVGNLIVYNGYFASANPNNILIYAKGSTTGKEITFTLPNPGRCDFFSASGNIFSAEGGYVYFYCNTTKVVNRLKITNGAATAADVSVDVVGGDLDNGCSQNHVMKDIFGNLVAHSRLNGIKALNVITNESQNFFILPNIKTNTLGGCSFELGGKEFWAYNVGSTAYTSEWNLYNVTDEESISNETLYAEDKTTTNKNQAANWLNVQVVDEKTAYIYQYCPTVAVAVWKVSRDHIVSATAENGTVEGTGVYKDNATATLTATPNEGYLFKNWTKNGEVVSTENPYSFTVTEDVELVANFDGPFCELILNTNDEAKGTVSGAGFYTAGQTATITATPKEGYKLLYWSDRSTENPRTITMNQKEALSAYFVKDYPIEPTFAIEKVWENTNVPASTNNGYQAVGWDEKIYMKDRLNASINVYTESGSELYAQLGSAVTDLAGDQPIAVDDAGNLVVRSGSTNFYDAPAQVTIYKKNETTPKVIDFTLPATGRCDFISASGDIYSTEGGYIYFYCMEQTTISRLYIKNGGANVADISVDALDATLTGGSSQSHVFRNIFGDLMAHTRATATKKLQEVNVVTGAVNTMNLPNFKESTLGGCSFELGGKELIAYNIAGTDYNSEWNLYNMTDEEFMSSETLYAKDKTSKKTNGAANWLNVQVVDEKTAYIYQFCPTVAVAVWKVTMHEVVLRDTENNKELLTDLNGSTTNVSVYRSLTGGMYNTLCLPFDVNELTGTPLENATVWQYNGATVKGDGTSKEIFLDFAEVTSITAGEPYLVEPAEDIAAPMEFKNVTISVANGSEAQHSAVTMHGILHPKELQANDKSILFLVENNNLAWANETANMNGMRAYFKVNDPSLLSARTRAYIRREPTVATDMENITTSETEIKKVIYNGTLYIIRGDEVYTIQGTKVK